MKRRATITRRPYAGAAFPYQLTWTVNGTKHADVFETVQAAISAGAGRGFDVVDRTGTLKRYHEALQSIGTVGQLSLPEDIQHVLADCSTIDTKLKMLEAIAEAMTCKA